MPHQTVDSMVAEIIPALITAESVVCIPAPGTEKVLSEYLLNEGMWRKMETTKSQRPFRHCVELALFSDVTKWLLECPAKVYRAWMDGYWTNSQVLLLLWSHCDSGRQVKRNSCPTEFSPFT